MYSNYLAQIMVAILNRNGECSPQRLGMLVFICDWVSQIRNQKRLTEVRWVRTQHAISAQIIGETIESFRDHFVRKQVIYGGVIRDAVGVNPLTMNILLPLDQEAIGIVNRVVDVTKKYDGKEFLSNVLGLFPVKTTEAGKVIDFEKTYLEYLKFKASE